MPQPEEEKLEAFMKERARKKRHFEQVVYPSYSLEEKIQHWGSFLHTQMRAQAEWGLDPYSIYTVDWYKEMKDKEPNLDLIMEQVIQRYWGTGAEWSKEEYLIRTGQV